MAKFIAIALMGETFQNSYMWNIGTIQDPEKTYITYNCSDWKHNSIGSDLTPSRRQALHNTINISAHRRIFARV